MRRRILALRWERFLAVLLVAVLVWGALHLRALSLGSGRIRLAMAPAPGESLYLASATDGYLYLLGPSGRAQKLSSLPRQLPLSLAASGQDLLLGMDAELALSRDGGRTWTDTGVSGERFLATALSGRWGLAAAWDSALWYTHDGGLTWSRAVLPSAYLQINSVAISPGGSWYAASEVALLRSRDQGATWSRVSGLPDRLTALSLLGGHLYVGTWRGQVLAQARGFRPVARVQGGVWALLGATWIATTAGLYESGRPAPLPRAEFVALVQSGATVYAGTALGTHVWALSGARWKPVFAGG